MLAAANAAASGASATTASSSSSSSLSSSDAVAAAAVIDLGPTGPSAVARVEWWWGPPPKDSSSSSSSSSKFFSPPHHHHHHHHHHHNQANLLAVLSRDRKSLSVHSNTATTNNHHQRLWSLNPPTGIAHFAWSPVGDVLAVLLAPPPSSAAALPNPSSRRCMLFLCDAETGKRVNNDAAAAATASVPNDVVDMKWIELPRKHQTSRPTAAAAAPSLLDALPTLANRRDGYIDHETQLWTPPPLPPPPQPPATPAATPAVLAILHASGALSLRLWGAVDVGRLQLALPASLRPRRLVFPSSPSSPSPFLSAPAGPETVAIVGDDNGDDLLVAAFGFAEHAARLRMLLGDGDEDDGDAGGWLDGSSDAGRRGRRSPVEAAAELAALVAAARRGVDECVREEEAVRAAAERERAVAEKMARDDAAPPPALALLLLLATGTAVAAPSIERFLSHHLGLRGLRRWRNATVAAVTRIKKTLFAVVAPAATRAALLLDEWAGCSPTHPLHAATSQPARAALRAAVALARHCERLLASAVDARYAPALALLRWLEARAKEFEDGARVEERPRRRGQQGEEEEVVVVEAEMVRRGVAEVFEEEEEGEDAGARGRPRRPSLFAGALEVVAEMMEAVRRVGEGVAVGGGGGEGGGDAAAAFAVAVARVVVVGADPAANVMAHCAVPDADGGVTVVAATVGADENDGNAVKLVRTESVRGVAVPVPQVGGVEVLAWPLPSLLSPATLVTPAGRAVVDVDAGGGGGAAPQTTAQPASQPASQSTNPTLPAPPKPASHRPHTTTHNPRNTKKKAMSTSRRSLLLLLVLALALVVAVAAPPARADPLFNNLKAKVGGAVGRAKAAYQTGRVLDKANGLAANVPGMSGAAEYAYRFITVYLNAGRPTPWSWPKLEEEMPKLPLAKAAASPKSKKGGGGSAEIESAVGGII
ncbi:hypothetical protein DFJ73DRAFT_792116 [Zopfochytrium polystomum]|nr:hypothetical protein DFJ73DRAFT_792116 [Zopfochytrium polystomum]